MGIFGIAGTNRSLMENKNMSKRNNKSINLVKNLSKNAENVLWVNPTNEKKYVKLERMIGEADAKNWKVWRFNL